MKLSLFGSWKKTASREQSLEAEVRKLYELYKSPFISFAQRNYGIDNETAEDIYQDSFLIMYHNVRSGEYEERFAKHNVSLKTYLFEIGKHRIYNHLSRERKEISMVQNLISEWSVLQYDSKEWNKAQQVVSLLIKEADTDCNKVLFLYYWKHYSMAEIARTMRYKTEQVAKNKKSSCLRRFSFELKKRLEAAGINWR